jgi:hypothetical protein
MEATTQNFGKWFFINRSWNLIALLNFYARHLGVKITGVATPKNYKNMIVNNLSYHTCIRYQRCVLNVVVVR